METLVFEHVPIEELPEPWRSRLSPIGDARVTVRIEVELPDTASKHPDPAFGIWQDRKDLDDVEAWLRQVRLPRHLGSRARDPE